MPSAVDHSLKSISVACVLILLFYCSTITFLSPQHAVHLAAHHPLTAKLQGCDKKRKETKDTRICNTIYASKGSFESEQRNNLKLTFNRIHSMALKFATKMSVGPRRGRTNLSRKQIVSVQKEKLMEKMERKQQRALKKQMAGGASAGSAKTGARAAAAIAKINQRTFDHDELQSVSEGLNATIIAMGETPSPLSLFACAMTAVTSTTIAKKQIPYLLVIIGACVGKLSQQVLHARMAALLKLAENLISENSHDDLIISKSVKMVESILSSVDDPKSSNVLQYLVKLEPSKMNSSLMPKYLQLCRKYIQLCCLTGREDFFYDAAGYFSALCCGCLAEAGAGVSNTAKKEFINLFEKTLSPARIESPEGRALLAAVIKEHLTPLFKPHTKHYWTHAADMVRTVFDRLFYLKRSPHASQFTSWFPGTIFLLRVLDKIRVVDDSMLNPYVERAMIAIGNCIPVSSFMEAVPFDPRDSDKLAIVDDDDLWRRSYTVGILRRIASHDSLPYLVAVILPILKHCESAVDASSEMFRVQWQALVLQYWRVVVSFCRYPLVVTDASIKAVAQTATIQLSKPLAETAANALRQLCDSFHSLATLDENELNGDGLDSKINLEDDRDFLSHFDVEWDPHVFHGISRTQAQEVCVLIGNYSKNIMPRLCNVFETNESTAILDAIQSFSHVCTPSVMQTILSGILAVGGNLDGDKTMNAKRRVILDIACAITEQLPAESLLAIFNGIIAPVLSEPTLEQRLLQKKSYKLLFSMMEHRLKDLVPIMSQIMDLLRAGQQHVTVSGLKMRVKCLSWAVDAYKMFDPEGIKAFIQQMVGEVILFAREHSSGARETAMEILEKMQRYLESGGYGAATLLHMVLAGLSGRSSMLVASTLVSMAKVISVSMESLPQSDVTGSVSVAARLLEHSASEVRSAAALLLRMLLKLTHKFQKAQIAVEAALPRICEAIAVTTSQAYTASTTRNMMRIVLSRCIRSFGYEKIESVFPTGSQRFLQYTNKMLKKEDRKERREQEKSLQGPDGSGAASKAAFNELFRGTLAQNAEADEDGEDLLEDGALNNMVAYKPAANNWLGKDDDKEDDRDRMCLVSEGGKLRVISKDERDRALEQAKRQAMADKLLRKGATIAADSLNETGKRGRDRDDDVEDFENEQLILRYGQSRDDETVKRQMAAKGIVDAPGKNLAKAFQEKREAAREEKRARFERDIRKGEEFEGRKGALGDVKKGTVDPYAYVPLDRRFMNKRHRKHAVGRFKAVITKGNLKGGKARTKQ